MKRSVREEKSIIIYFGFYIVLVLWLIIFFFVSILPSIKEIEEEKNITQWLRSNIDRVYKEWITLEEFKKLNKVWEENKVVSEILKNITKDFYDKNLMNSEYPTYWEFISEKRKELNSDEHIETIAAQNLKIAQILPTYSDNWILLWNNEMTDYKFINYIESLIESFNLTTSNSIWIKRVDLLEEFAVLDKNGDNLWSNIYSIPLSLELNWTKAWIIDFLYFVDNVWKIEIREDNIIVNTDYWYLSKNWVPKVLEWDEYIPWEYNIFENQIMDISKITISNYIDNRYTSFRWSNDFKEFILKTQWNDDFKIKVDLNFYIKWQPIYKIKEFILYILDEHKKATIFVNNLIKNTKITSKERFSLNKEKDILKGINKEVVILRKNLNTWENIDTLYKKALRMEELIFPIFKKNKYINNVFNNSKKVKNKLEWLVLSDKLSKVEKKIIESNIDKINSLDIELKKLEKSINIWEKINDSYKRIIEIDFILDKIWVSLTKK